MSSKEIGRDVERLAPSRPVYAEQVFAPLARQAGSVWLDGGDGARGWTVLAWSPARVEVDPPHWPRTGRSLTGRHPSPVGVPFIRGCIGLLSYGAGAAVEAVPVSAATPEPTTWLGRYRGALCWRHRDGAWFATGDADIREQARGLLDRADPLGTPAPPTGRAEAGDRDQFLTMVRRALESIRQGDVYQVNLSRAVHVVDAGAPWEAWRRLRQASAPARGAWLGLGDGRAVLSHSPETLLTARGSAIATCPIKGTRPRGGSRASDRALARELRDSAKEIAELTMIVDLCRNDLGRVCQPGTIRCGSRRLDRHPYVLHASQRISGQLRPGLDAWDALAALFPPGSVTGCPKVRATWLIHELEPEPRGAYCGAIGFVSEHGRAGWSVAIRTAIFHGDQARYHVGAGIVADSIPEAEWEETRAKERLLQAALTRR